ncbi:MAG: carboxypeptidase regulatory-like domain-containing protein [Zoogloea sp.]|nr:carboxypeptidase regulatory-like domain-containing protein [Zoogloea sp.]
MWLDSNGNGQQDTGEAGVQGVKVTLLDASGNPVGASLTTDVDGNYLFTGLKPGTYSVQFDKTTLPAGYSFHHRQQRQRRDRLRRQQPGRQDHPDRARLRRKRPELGRRHRRQPGRHHRHRAGRPGPRRHGRHPDRRRHGCSERRQRRSDRHHHHRRHRQLQPERTGR